MATPYQITINMSQDTVSALLGGGYSLYAFKGVQTTMQGGAPLVWFQSRTFSQSTVVSWEEQYQGYTSQSAIVSQGTITAGASYNMNLGSTLQITDAAGDGTVVTGGTQNALSLLNQTTSPFASSGISQLNETTNTATPLCAFPLYGGNMNVFAPIELVFLEFATQAVNTGTVIYQSFSPGALFNLTTESELAVTFDINEGWVTSDPNITPYAAGTNLAPVLLVSSPSLAKRAVGSFQRVAARV